MRPIKLKIKGLNSFIEEQTIDFNRLTARGLFGIFGPTGSGKSTILDGITLALYGEVSRKSTNFINTNMDNCNVSFEFSISSGSSSTKVYRVEREFKTDKKTGNPRSGKCKITDITYENNTLVLADKVTEVTGKCEEIIGLTLDDFTRTVVLPQGKFSEFLKLEGKSRRDMLERLFNLQKYGENLSIKLSREIAKNKQQDSYLDGILSDRENINEDNYTILKDELEKTINEYKKSNTIAEALNKKYEESQNIWNLQNELNKYNASKSDLLLKKEEMEQNGHKIERAEAVLRVLPYYNNYKNAAKAIRDTSEQLGNSQNSLEQTKVEKQKAEIKYNDLKQQREKELPQLTLKLEKAKDCISLAQNLNKNIIDINIAQDELDSTIVKIKKDKEVIESLVNSIDLTGKNIEKLEVEANSLKVEPSYKNKVLQGLEHQKDLEKAKKDIDDKTIKLNKLTSEIATNEQKKYNLEAEYSNLIADKDVSEDLLSKLKENAPIHDDININSMQNEIVNMQQQVNEHNKTWSTFTRLSEEINNQKSISTQCIDKIAELENNKAKLEAEINELKKQIEIKKKDALVYELRKTMHENDVCPVCGSQVHDLEHLHSANIEVENNTNINSSTDIQNMDIDRLNEKLKSIEKSHIDTISSISACKSRLHDSQDIISNNNTQIGELDKNHLAISVDDMQNKYSSFKSAIEGFIQEYETLSKKIDSIDKEISNKAIELKGISDNIINQSNEKNSLLTEKQSIIDIYNKTLDVFNSIAAETGVNSFLDEYDNICSKETKRETILTNISTERNNLSTLNKKHNDVLGAINIHQQTETKLNTEINQKKEACNNIRKEISDKIGNVDNIDLYITQLNTNINKLNSEFNSIEIYKDSCSKRYDEANEAFIQLQSKLNELISNKEKYTNDLNASIREEGFESIEQLNDCYIDKIKLNELISILNDYKNSLARYDGMIDGVKNKLDGRSITEQEYNNSREEKLQNDKSLAELNDKKIQLTSEINIFKKKLDEIKSTLIEKEKLAHKLGLLADLEKLFKGKKFVEYAALERLRYISREADKRLKEISSGTYGLEADENGKFIIRDYKNGGAMRDASTLSGGETFITSLALALSLSAEIQLKGTAPLELFFLDEGFGTLDDELLDVVMSSLDGIYSDKLKIGIISHVESIKNRVPVKLLVTPAEAGMGGSKVKLDY